MRPENSVVHTSTTSGFEISLFNESPMNQPIVWSRVQKAHASARFSNLEGKRRNHLKK